MLSINQGGQFSSWQAIGNGSILEWQHFYIYFENGAEPEIITYPKHFAGLRQFDMDADGRAELLLPGDILVESCRKVRDGSGWITLCGDELHTVEIDLTPTVDEQIGHGERYDESIYRYKAVKFIEQTDGTFSAEIHDTPLVGSASQTAAIDSFGNGLNDFVFAYGCREPSIEGDCVFNDIGVNNPMAGQPNGVYINRNRGSATGVERFQPTDMLMAVENGLNYRDEWEYRPLTSQDEQFHSSTLPFYERDDAYLAGLSNAAQQAHLHFTSSMYVVAEHRYSNGVNNNLNRRQYRYKGAMMNREGRGFQGFRSVIIEDLDAGLMSRSEFHQAFPLAGQLHRTYQWTLDEVTHDNLNTLPKAITENQFSWQFWPVTASNGRDGPYAYNITQPQDAWEVTPLAVSYFVGAETQTKLSRALTASRAQLNRTDITIVFDDWGNEISRDSTVDNGFTVVKTTNSNSYFAVNESDWWLDKLQQSISAVETLSGTVPYEAALDPKKQTKTDFTWTANRQPDLVTTTPMLGGGIVSNVDTDYNAYGLPTSLKTYETETDIRQITSTYSNNGTTASADGYFVFTVTNALNQTITTQTWPEHGQVRQVLDANGLVSTTDYDVFGRVEKSTPPAGTGQSAYSRFAWCKGGCDAVLDSNIQYKVTTYQAGSPPAIVYKDNLNRPLVTLNQNFASNDVYVRVYYDELGQKAFESVPSASVTSLLGTTYQSYDLLGRLTRKLVSQTQGQSMLVEYNHEHATAINAPFTTQIVVNSGEKILYRTYSGNNQLMQTTDALGAVTRYAYDAMGNPIVLEDANGAKIKATYNALGQKKWVDDPNMGRKDFTYSSFGEVSTETDARSNLTSYGYDGLGRLISRSVAGIDETSSASFVFDKENLAADKCVGLPSREYKNDGSEFAKSYHYNDECQLVSVKTTIDGSTFEVVTQFDGNYGRPKALTYPTGLTLGYDYTEEGYLKRIYNAVSGYIYRDINTVDEQGNWTTASYADNNASIERQFYPATGQMQYSRWYSATNLQQELIYDYEGYGNLQQQTVNNFWGGVSKNSIESYVYDDMRRLTTSSLSTDGLNNGSVNYAYDAVGNIKKKTDFSSDNANAYSYLPVGTVRNTANGWAGSNAVRSVTLSNGATRTYNYNENGNLIDDGIRAVSYNALNKPTHIQVSANTINPKLDSQATGSSSADLFYGSDELRYKQVKLVNGETTTLVYVDKLFEQVTRKNSVGTVISIEKKSYIDDIAVVTEKSEGSSTSSFDVNYFHRDRLGSMTAEINELGVMTKGHSFDAFGRPREVDLADKSPLQVLAGNSTNRGFTDHEHLDESQLIHMNGRVYDYNLGRFLSVDPFIQEPGNSQSMNPYSYVMNNPLAGTDPSGYVTVWDRDKCKADCDAELESILRQLGFDVFNGKVDPNSSKVTSTTIDSLMSDEKEEISNIGGSFNRNTKRKLSTSGGTLFSTSRKTSPPDIDLTGGKFPAGSCATANCAAGIPWHSNEADMRSWPEIMKGQEELNDTMLVGLGSVLLAPVAAGVESAITLRLAIGKWGVSIGGVNQGIKHFFEYMNRFPKRVQSLEKRLGLDEGTFSDTWEGFKNFTSEALNIVKNSSSVRQLKGNKTAFFVEGAEKAKKGVAVIMNDGKLQSMMPSDPKSFLKLE